MLTGGRIEKGVTGAGRIFSSVTSICLVLNPGLDKPMSDVACALIATVSVKDLRICCRNKANQKIEVNVHLIKIRY